MQHVAIDDVRRSPVRSTRRELSDPLATTDVAVNHYEVGPGEAFSGSLHAHAGQEEVFVVLSGRATFQLEAGSVEVGPREAVRFAPGEYQRGYNAGEATVVALALGAPRVGFDESPVTALVDCTACGERTRHDVQRVDDAFERTCRACGTENDPGPPPRIGD